MRETAPRQGATGSPGHQSVAGEQRKSAVQQENHTRMKADAFALARVCFGPLTLGVIPPLRMNRTVVWRRGKVGEVSNLAWQDGRRGRDGAERKAHTTRETALHLAALARARLETSPTLPAVLATSVRLFVRDGVI